MPDEEVLHWLDQLYKELTEGSDDQRDWNDHIIVMLDWTAVDYTDADRWYYC